MDLEEVAVYRRNLQNYRFYKREIEKHNDRLLELRTIQIGLKSPRFDGVAVQGSQDPYYLFCKKDDIREEINKEIEKRSVFIGKVDDIESDLSLMREEIANVIMNVYCLRKTTIYRESKKVNMDVSTLKRHINKEIWKVIKIKS